MTAANAIAKYRLGQPVVLAVIGNSVGCGYYGSGYANIPSISLSNKKLTDAGRISNVCDGGWPTRLRLYLQKKNASSQLYNFSGDGWDSNDHRGLSGSSGVVGPTATVPQILAMSTLPDLVFLALQINDPNHGLSLATFETNTRAIISGLTAAGVPVVMVKESPATLTNYASFVTKAGDIATELGLPILDFNSLWPLTSTGYMYDSLHPQDGGHARMAGAAINWLDFQASASRPPLKAYNSTIAFPLAPSGALKLTYSGTVYAFAMALPGSYAMRTKSSGAVYAVVNA